MVRVFGRLTTSSKPSGKPHHFNHIISQTGCPLVARLMIIVNVIVLEAPSFPRST